MAGVTGSVSCRVSIDSIGLPTQVEALEGPAILRPAAVAYLQRWMFEPQMAEGKPIPFTTRAVLRYTLGDAPPNPGPVQAVLRLSHPATFRSMPLDLKALEAEARQVLHCMDVEVLGDALPPGADPDRTLQFDLDLRTVQSSAKARAFQVNLRASSVRDAKLEKNPRNGPQRVWFFHVTAGTREEEGFQEQVAWGIKDVLGNLANLPRSWDMQERFHKEWLKASLPTSPGQAEPKVVESEFSRVKVRKKPAAPSYPPLALERGIEGTVVIQLLVDADGKASRCVVKEGPSELLLTALGYALTWEFEPARILGVPTSALFTLTMPFRLRSPLLTNSPSFDPRRY
jgi:TonB family protein